MQLPAHLQKYQPRDLGQTLSQNLGATSPPYVSIAGGRFTLIDAAGNELPGGAFDQQLGVYLDACIIDAGDHISRVYYKDAYDPAAQTFSPPDCWSDNGVGPSVSCSAPQSPTCASCQWAVWGSAISAQGKAIPACGMYQKVALMIPGHPQVVFLLRVPPNSHKNLRAYNELSKRSGVDISNVITRIYFDRTTQGTLLFSGVNFIDEGLAQAREAAYVEKKTDAIVGRNDVARPALAAPVNVPQQIAPPTQQFMPQGTSGYVSSGPTTGQAPQSMFGQTAAQTQQISSLSGTGQATTFVPPSQPAAVPQTTASVAAPQNGASPAAAPPQRRRRRTQAEIAADNAAAQQPAQTASPAAAPQAPFPVSNAPGSLPGQTDMGFGMSNGQPASANPEVAAALDSFFGAAS